MALVQTVPALIPFLAYAELPVSVLEPLLLLAPLAPVSLLGWIQS